MHFWKDVCGWKSNFEISASWSIDFVIMRFRWQTLRSRIGTN